MGTKNKEKRIRDEISNTEEDIKQSPVNSVKKKKKKQRQEKRSESGGASSGKDKTGLEMSMDDSVESEEDLEEGKKLFIDNQYKSKSEQKLIKTSSKQKQVPTKNLKRKLVHDVSDSDDNIDKDINSMVARDISFEMEPMSDFSIASPSKRPKRHQHIVNLCRYNADEENKPKQRPSFETEGSSQDDGEDPVGKNRKQEVKLRFKIPEGFKDAQLPNSKSDIYKEDLQDKELWLIKAPINFDMKLLNGQEIDLEGTKDLNADMELFEISASKDTTGEMAHFSAVFPCKEKPALSLGPSFKGQIHIMESLEVPELPPIVVPQHVPHTLSNKVFRRSEPFGSGKPIIIQKSQDDSMVSPDEDERRESKHKKSKKKKKHKS